MRPRNLLNLLLFLALFLVLTPFVLMTWSDGTSGAYWRHLLATQLYAMTSTSVGLVLWGSLCTFILGTIPAWIMARYTFPGKRMVAYCMLLPLAYPTYLLAMIYQDITAFMGPIWQWLSTFGLKVADNHWMLAFEGLGGLLFVMSFALSPFVYLVMYVAFTTLSRNYADVATSVGLSRLAILRRIELPLLLPASLASLCIVASALFGEYGSAVLFGERSLSVAIFEFWHVFNKGEVAAQMAFGMIGVVLVVLVLLFIYLRRSKTYNPVRAALRHSLTPLCGARGITVALVCLISPLVGFAVPSAALLVWGGRFLERTNMDQLFSDLGNSLLFAGTSCLLTLALGAALAIVHRAAQTMSVTRFLIALANIGFFLPSSAVSIGILYLQATHLNGLAGDILCSSWAALLCGALFRHLFYGFASIRIGMERSHPDLADTARTYVASSPQRLWRVHLPIIRPWLMAGAVFTFVSVFKELSLVLSLAPYNFSTLSTRIYYAATYGTVHECALWGLVMAVVSIYPLMAVGNAITVR